MQLFDLLKKIGKKEKEETPHEETGGIDPTMSKREALLTLIKEDMGEFPYEALWGEKEPEGKLLQIISIGLGLVILITILIKL